MKANDANDAEKYAAQKTRLVALVIALTGAGWVAAQFFGKLLGLPGRYAVLFDLAALAGFFWALVVIVQIWRARREN